jgi:DNA-binding beta-propeller fold protein YncE
MVLVQLSGLAFNTPPAEAVHRNPSVIGTIHGLGALTTNMAVDDTRNRVYVAHRDGAVSVIEGATHTAVATIPLGVFSDLSNPDVAVNPKTNRVYVTVSDASERALLVVIDGATSSVLGTVDLGGTRAWNVAVNPDTNRIYVFGASANFGDADQTGVFVVNGSDNEVEASIPVSHCFDHAEIQVNPQTNVIYLAEPGCAFFNQALWVIDGATNALATVPLDQSFPYAVAVDSQTNRVYVGSVVSNAISPPTRVSVVDGESSTVTGTIDGVAGDVALDPTPSGSMQRSSLKVGAGLP